MRQPPANRAHSRIAVRATVITVAVLLVASCVSVRLGTTGRVSNLNDEAFRGGELTVVTFNMLHGFADAVNDATLETRLDLLADQIAALRPDVVLLQEASVTATRRHGNVVDRLVDRVNQLAPAGFSYNSVFFTAHGSRLVGFFEGSAVLSRYAIESAERLRYADQSWWPPEGRIAVVARLASTTVPVAVVSTHITNVETDRGIASLKTRQAEELAGRLSEWSADGALIVGGDFNSTPDSAAVAAMADAGAVDAWVAAGTVKGRPNAAAGLDDGGRLDAATSLQGAVDHPGARYGRRIDYIFVYGDAEVVAASRVLDRPAAIGDAAWLWASDHAGVLVRLAVPAFDRNDR